VSNRRACSSLTQPAGTVPLAKLPILLSLILSGVSCTGHSGLSAQTRSTDGKHRSSRGHRYLDMRAVPGSHQYSSSSQWVYNHISLSPDMLTVACGLSPALSVRLNTAGSRRQPPAARAATSGQREHRHLRGVSLRSLEVPVQGREQRPQRQLRPLFSPSAATS
jgi:hypothetical protein